MNFFFSTNSNFSDFYFFATCYLIFEDFWSLDNFIFETWIIWSFIIHSLNHQRSTTSWVPMIYLGIGKFKFVAKTQFLFLTFLIWTLNKTCPPVWKRKFFRIKNSKNKSRAEKQTWFSKILNIKWKQYAPFLLLSKLAPPLFLFFLNQSPA